MLKPPPVIITETPVIEAHRNHDDLTAHTEELHYDRFPLASLAEQGRDTEILMLGGAPISVAIAVIAAIVSANVIKFFSERNDLGISMRSSEGER